MRSVLLTLMVSLTQVQLSSPCPDSCIVCSEDAIICNKLSSIIEAPDSTKALMLTDGLIDTVSSIVFSDSSNMSVLALSNNVISTILDNAFQNLTVLRTLLLDRNLISNQGLNKSTFSWLHKLESLHLGNNALRDIDGSWFQSTRALRTLLLEGNLLTGLNSSTFASSDLRNLEILDLSDNLIAYLGQNSFRSLPRLRSLDLSRNKLQNAPDAFSYLSWLSVLNLELNRWNCTCELRELASFLSSYIQSPDKVLYNGQRLACVSSDNPAVQTVLELTDANCAPANSNITVTVVAKSSITPPRYIRDVAVTAACSFLGGVAITLGVLVVVYRNLGKRFRLLKDENEAGERSSQASVQWDVTEGKEALSMAYSLHNSNYGGHQPWDIENVSHGAKSDLMDNRFICHNCSSTTLGTGYQEGGRRREALPQRANHTEIQPNRKDSWSALVENNQWKETEGRAVLQSGIKDIRAQRRVEKGNGTANIHHLRGQEHVPQGGDLRDMSTMRMQQLALRRHIPDAQRQTFTPKEPKKMHQRAHGNHMNNISYVLKHQHEEYGALPVYQTINCMHCHQTYEYRQAGHENQDILFRSPKEADLPSEEKVSEAVLFRDSFNYTQSSTESQGREQKSVTFDLSGALEKALLMVPSRSKEHEEPYRFSKIKMSRTSDQRNNPKPGKASAKVNSSSTYRLSKTLKGHKAGSQLSRKLKVKLNLNPLRRNRVHSTSSHEDGGAGGMSITGKKARHQKAKKGKISMKSGSSGSKAVKAMKGSKHSDESEKEEDLSADEKTSSKRKAPKKNDQGSKGNNRKDNSEILNGQGDTSFPADEEHQDNNNVLSADSHPTTAAKHPSSETSAVPLTHSFTLSTAAAVTNPDPNQLEGIRGPQEELPGPQEVGESSSTNSVSTEPPVVQEYLSSGDGSPKRRIRLILPEKTSNRPQTALERKIR